MHSHHIFRKIYTLLLLISVADLNDINIRGDRLLKLSIPSHYSLDLILDPRASTYDGFVEINFINKNFVIDVIQLHASNETITIQDALLNFEHTCTPTDYDEEYEIITLVCPKNSISQQSSLVIHFQGTFSTSDVSGLYKSTYTEGDEENVLLSTQFEFVAARRAFPCFDEPDLKATFDIFITHPDDYNVLANTPVKRKFSVASNQIQTQFETTPSMSTYLVAFIVSKFVANSNSANMGYDYQVFSRPSAVDFTNVATTYGPTLISLLSNWTGIDYKDLGNTQAYQVAIPDFAAGAMENWGLITFREVDLLDEQNITSNSAKQRIITTIAHELSHQWFGDYVTLDWWSDTWLNEGFATYFEYYIPDQLEDNLDTMRQFVVNELQLALQADAVPSALPLTSDAYTGSEIDAKFDTISYSKGGSIVRMLRNIIGETAFREGLQSYLKTYKYNNTDPSQLLSSFEVKTYLGLDKIMKNWIYNAGFPLVTANLNGSTIILTQERFTLQNTTDVEPTQWYIPLSYTTSAEKNFNINITAWIDPSMTQEIVLQDASSWIIFNLQQAGYYRVNYDNELWHRLITALDDNTNNIDVLNRAQLIDDAFNIARAGRLSYEIAFHLAEYLKSETEYYPWVSTLNAMSFISGKLDDYEAESLLQSKILSWINTAFPPNKTNAGTGHVDKLKEVLILNWACRVGQSECIAYANETFQNYKTNRSLPDYNKRSIVFCHGFRNSSQPAEDYDFLFNLFKNSSSVVEQNEIISSLGCTENDVLLEKYLLQTIDVNTPIRKQDAALVFKAVYTNSAVGVNVSLSFLEKNLQDIADVYKGMNALPNLILALADKVNSDDEISQLTKIIEDNSDMEDIKIIGQRAIDIATANRNWTNTYAAEIKKILQESPNAANVPQPTSFFLIITFAVVYLFYRE